jgi:hypothetical protein
MLLKRNIIFINPDTFLARKIGSVSCFVGCEKSFFLKGFLTLIALEKMRTFMFRYYVGIRMFEVALTALVVNYHSLIRSVFPPMFIFPFMNPEGLHCFVIFITNFTFKFLIRVPDVVFIFKEVLFETFFAVRNVIAFVAQKRLRHFETRQDLKHNLFFFISLLKSLHWHRRAVCISI